MRVWPEFPASQIVHERESCSPASELLQHQSEGRSYFTALYVV